MAKISLSKLKLEKNTNINTFVFNEQEVEVLSYLPVSEKIDLVGIAIQESTVGDKLNAFKLDALFHLYIVYAYTNIGFTPTQRENELETYDLLEKSGLIDEVVKAIPKEEYEDLLDKFMVEVEKSREYNTSILGLVNNFVSSLPDVISGLNKSLGEIDDEKISGLLSIAKEHGAN